MASTSSSSTYVPSAYMYDVFLCFRGEEIRYYFTDYLYAALCEGGISTFKNYDEAWKSKKLKPEIERLITESRASIIVISQYFANLSCCLDEHWLILEKRRKGNYYVPSDVWNQWGNFAVDAKEGSEWTADNVNRWKAALTEIESVVSVISGYGHAAVLIPNIVKQIQSELGSNLQSTPLNFNHFNDHDMEGTFIGKLFVSSKKIAKGSNGTVVFEGYYHCRKVAVKRLVRARHDDVHHDYVFREIQNLIAADEHQNIVRWYDTTYASNFFYIALELCDSNLYDLMQNKMYSESFPLWRPNGFPSSNLLGLMRDIVAGLVHLHKLGIIHRDLKPHNVLIVRREFLCVKLADMGISRPLIGDASSLGSHATVSGTSRWRAPEQIPRGPQQICHGRQTTAMDLFSSLVQK